MALKYTHIVSTTLKSFSVKKIFANPSDITRAFSHSSLRPSKLFARAMSKQNFAKLNALTEIEQRMQAFWHERQLFNADVPDPSEIHKKKFLVTFPYPYMNGRLHLGHSFSVSKCEFTVGFNRMRDYNTLFPFGLHCTGMPIKACADKLKYEIDHFGFPPDFTSESTNNVVVKKSKVAAKTGNVSRQWQIMKSFNLTDDEIKKFVDPYHWCEYFPEKTIADLQSFGIKVDWRRSFITTDANPFYDAFVRWQMNLLKKLDKVKFGKRYCIYSNKDCQPCMDHDRYSGEGVGPVEYTVLRFLLEKCWVHEKVAQLDKNSDSIKVFLLAATTRPETLYGVTNIWVHPDHKYVVVKLADGAYGVASEHSVRNMAHQDILDSKFGSYQVLFELDGKEMINLKVDTFEDYCHYKEVSVLPMMSLLSGKGTGVVMSVPSDSPHDLASLNDLLNKQALREKYGIDQTFLRKPINFITTSENENEDLSLSELLVSKLKITSQNDSVKITQAKDQIYKSSFYSGKINRCTVYMQNLLSTTENMLVKNAKGILSSDLNSKKHSFVYNEPESTVISRSGDECVVALIDQWYLDYGEEHWLKQTKLYIEKCGFNCDETRNSFNSSIDWLRQHACARAFGLGTKLPWDQSLLVESLTDSVIYMAYYTISNFLHSTSEKIKIHQNLNGRLSDFISSEEMTDEVFDMIFLNVTSASLQQKMEKDKTFADKLNSMRASFDYWYPVDLRSSGKDLIPNHLLFYFYCHAAIFDEQKQPKFVAANGHLLLNSEKMSKSSGNFLTLNEAIARYGADAVRFALADAGDTLDDANFVEKTADNAVLRLYNFLVFCQDYVEFFKSSSKKAQKKDLYADILANEMDQHVVNTYNSYDKMQFKNVLKSGFFEFQNSKDYFMTATSTVSESKNTLTSNNNVFFEEYSLLYAKMILTQIILLNPICSHICEHIYQMLRQEKVLVFLAENCEAFRNIDKIEQINSVSDLFEALYRNAKTDIVMTKKKEYIDKLFRLIRKRLPVFEKKNKKSEKSVKIYYTNSFNEWQQRIVDAIKEHLITNEKLEQKDLIALLNEKMFGSSEKNKKLLNKYMSFVEYLKKESEGETLKEYLSKDNAVFEEKSLLREVETLVKREFKFEKVELVCQEEASEAVNCAPMDPDVVFY